MKNNIIIYGFVIWALIVFGACNSQETIMEVSANEESVLELSEMQVKNAEIVIDTAQYRVISRRISARGVVSTPPQNTQSVHIPYGGYIRMGELLPGTQIKKGQILFWVKNPDFIELQKKYLELSIKQKQLNLELTRQKSLYVDKINAQKEVEKIESETAINQVALNAVSAQLRLSGFQLEEVNSNGIRFEIPYYAENSGLIRDIHVGNGAYVSAQNPILTLHSFEDLHLELRVFEKDWSAIKIGQTIDFNLLGDAQNTAPRKANVFLVSANIQSDGAAMVHAHLSKDYSEMRPGMMVNASIYLGEQKALVLPESAIVNFEGKNYAFYTLDGSIKSPTIKFKMFEIAIGIQQDGFAQILPIVDSENWDKKRWVVNGARALLGQLKNKE